MQVDKKSSSILKDSNKKYTLEIINFKTRVEAQDKLFNLTGDDTYKHPRMRNYEIVDEAMMDGYIINIDEVCPINGFKSGYKNIEQVREFWKDNLDKNGETIWNEMFDWIDNEFKNIGELEDE